MTLAASSRYKLYQPVVSTTVFQIPFDIFDESDVRVFVDRDELAPVNFTVSGSFSNGRSSDAIVTLNSGVSNVDLEIYGSRPAAQSVDLKSTSPDLASSLESMVDEQAASMQEVQRDVDQAIRVSPTVASGVRLAEAVAGKMLTLDPADKTKIIMGPSSASVFAAETNAAAAAAEAAALSTRNVIMKAADFTVSTANKGHLFQVTAIAVASLPDALTAGDGFWFSILTDGGDCTVDPSGAELIDGASTILIPSGQEVTIYCSGVEWLVKIPSASGPHTHRLADITDSGTAAALNVAAAGDAAAGQVVLGSDSRLTDSRAPTAHTHTLADVSDSGTAAALNVAASGDATAGQVVKGNDTRLSDARAPTAHAHSAADVTTGTLAHERGGLEADVSAYSGLLKISAGATSEITDNSANWNAAFGWGDHALAGYASAAHSHAVADLSDTTITTPTAGQVLSYNGSAWVNGAAGGISTLNEIGNVTITSNTAGELLKWSGTAWVNNTLAEAGVQPADAGLTSLAGLSVAAGDLLYATGADTFARLPAGTAGQALQVNTGATAPEWVSPVRAVADLSDWPVGLTATELGYVDGVTSAIQTQLDGKAAAAHTHATSDLSDWPAAVSATEVGYLDGVTSALQTQINAKPSSDPTGVTGADAITNIISLTQTEYDAIGTKNASTVYVISG